LKGCAGDDVRPRLGDEWWVPHDDLIASSIEEQIKDDQHDRGNTQQPTQNILTHFDSPKLQMPVFSKARAFIPGMPIAVI
jgi:hypothetical protein